MDLLSTLHAESFFRITKDGINFDLVDGTVAQVIEATWVKDNFVEYSCDKDMKIGMDLQMLDKIMKRAKKEDDITFSLSEKGANFQISSGKKFTLQVIANPHDIKERSRIKAEVKVEFEISLKKLKEIVDDVLVVDDFMHVICQKNMAVFSANNKVNTAATSISIPDNDSQVDNTYSLMFLTAIISAFGNTVENVHLGFIPHGPLRLRCDVAPLGEIKYYLAPKLEKQQDGQ